MEIVFLNRVPRFESGQGHDPPPPLHTVEGIAAPTPLLTVLGILRHGFAYEVYGSIGTKVDK